MLGRTSTCRLLVFVGLVALATGTPTPRANGVSVPVSDAPQQQGGRYDAENWREFWSFKPVARPAPPVVGDEQWARNTVDRFVLAKLEASRLKPAPEADKPTLIRRATFDLTGLPPTPEEIRAF